MYLTNLFNLKSGACLHTQDSPSTVLLKWLEKSCKQKQTFQELPETILLTLERSALQFFKN